MTAVSDSLQLKTIKSPGISTKRTYLSGASLPNQPAQDGEMPQKHATVFVTVNQPSCHVLAQPQTLSHTHLHAGAEICIRFNATRGCTRGEACKFKHRLWRGTPSQQVPLQAAAHLTDNHPLTTPAICRRFKVSH